MLMKVATLTVDPFTDLPIVVLKDQEGRRSVPIGIGLCEAAAIATELERIHLDRPGTHDLMKNILSALGVAVEGVEIHDLVESTFYARLHLLDGAGRRLPRRAPVGRHRPGPARRGADPRGGARRRARPGARSGRAPLRRRGAGPGSGRGPPRWARRRLVQVEDVGRPRWIRFVPALIYAAGIFVLSSIPGDALPPSGFAAADKLVHFVLFAGLGGLVTWAWRRPVASATAAALYGVLDELHQRFTPGRAPSVYDAVADLLGAALGAALVWTFFLRRGKRDADRSSFRGQTPENR